MQKLWSGWGGLLTEAGVVARSGVSYSLRQGLWPGVGGYSLRQGFWPGWGVLLTEAGVVGKHALESEAVLPLVSAAFTVAPQRHVG